MVRSLKKCIYSLGQCPFTDYAVVVVRHREGGGTIPSVVLVVLLLKGKCPTLFNPSMGRLHRVLALRVLLPVADDETGLEGQLWQSSKSQPCSCFSLKVG